MEIEVREGTGEGEEAAGAAPGGWRWRALSGLGTAAGITCLTTLIWAVNVRLDRWEIQPFVLLIYGALVAAVASSLAAARAKRAGEGGLEALQGVRLLLWLAVCVILLWVWFPPMERLVGWWIRQVSMFRFS